MDIYICKHIYVFIDIYINIYLSRNFRTIIEEFANGWESRINKLNDSHLIIFILFVSVDILLYIFVWIPVSVSIRENVILLLF